MLRRALFLITLTGLPSVCAAPEPKELVKEVHVTGTVVDMRTDEPVAYAGVDLNLVGQGGGRRGQRPYTDKAGRFEDKLQPGEYKLRVMARGYHDARSRVTIAPQMKPLRIPLASLPRIRGRVLKPDGTPLVNGRLDIKWGLPPRWGRPQPSIGGVGLSWYNNSAWTDDKGYYQAHPSGPAWVRMEVRARGVGHAVADPVEVRQDDVEGVGFLLEPFAEVSGQARARGTGEPIRTGSLYLMSTDDETRGGSCWPDKQGRFTVEDVPAGQYELRAYSQQVLHGMPGIPVSLQPGQQLSGIALELWPAVKISGRILRPGGGAVADTEMVVWLSTRDANGKSVGRQRCPVTTDGEGRYEVAANYVGRTEVSVFVPTVGWATSTRRVEKGREVVNLDLDLRALLIVRGQVRDRKTKRPIADATVGTSYNGGGMHGELPTGCGHTRWHATDKIPGSTGPGASTTTDAEGRFELKGLVPGNYTTEAWHKQYLRSEGPKVSVSADAQTPELTVELDLRSKGTSTPPPTYVVRGRVVDRHGQPVTRAKVWVSRNTETVTDEQGQFAFKSPESLSAVWAKAPGWTTVGSRLDKHGRQQQEVTLQLRQRGGAMSGRVVRGDTREPVANAVVVASESLPVQPHWGHPSLPDTLPDTDARNDLRKSLRHTCHAVTDQQGGFVLADLAEGDYTLYATGQDLYPGTRYGCTVFEGRTTRTPLVEMWPIAATQRQAGQPPLTFSGRLLRPDGTLASRAEVRWVWRVRWGSVTHAWWGVGATGADGTLPVSVGDWPADPNPGRLLVGEVLIEVEGFRPVLIRDLVNDRGPHVGPSEVTLQTGKPGEVAGRVTMPGGERPAVGVHVVPFTTDRLFAPGRWGLSSLGIGRRDSEPAHYAHEYLATMTDDRGVFRIKGLWGGEYGLLVTPQWNSFGPRRPLSPDDPLRGVAPATVATVLVEDGKTAELDLTIPAAGSIEGTAVNGQGEPLPQLPLYLRMHPRRFPLSAYIPWKASSDERGRFRIESLAPGIYEVTPRHREDCKCLVEVRPGRVAEILVRITERENTPKGVGTVSGRVLLPDGETPAKNARVVRHVPIAWPPAAPRYEICATTDEHGLFTGQGVPEGACGLTALKPGYGRAETERLEVQPEAEVSNVTLVLSEAGVIRGKVLAEDDRSPAAGAVVGAASEGDDLSDFCPGLQGRSLARVTSVDSRGRFELRDVPPGRTRLFVYAARWIPTHLPPAHRRHCPSAIRVVERVMVSPGETMEGVVLRLGPLGVVVDEASQ